MTSGDNRTATPTREVLEGGGGDRRSALDLIPDGGQVAGHVARVVRRHPAVLAVPTVVALLVVTWLTAPGLLRPLHQEPQARAIWLAVLGGDRLQPAAADGGVPGGIGAPAGTVVPGLRLALMVEAGDSAVDLTSPPGAGPVLRSVAESDVRVQPGRRADVTLGVAPTDCNADPASGEAWLSLLGREVQPAPGVVTGLARAVRVLCAAAPPVTVTPVDRPDSGPMRVRVDWRGPVDRVVLTPLDDEGARGLGAVELTSPGDAELVWSGGAGSDGPRRVQVFAVVNGIAWPAVVTLSD